MTTIHIIQTIIEIAISLLLIIGFWNEEKLIALENMIIDSIKEYIKNQRKRRN